MPPHPPDDEARSVRDCVTVEVAASSLCQLLLRGLVEPGAARKVFHLHQRVAPGGRRTRDLMAEPTTTAGQVFATRGIDRDRGFVPGASAENAHVNPGPPPSART